MEENTNPAEIKSRVLKVNEYFAGRSSDSDNPLPTKAVRMSDAYSIVQPYVFVDWNLSTVNEHAKDLGCYISYLEQLEDFMNFLIENQI